MESQHNYPETDRARIRRETSTALLAAMLVGQMVGSGEVDVSLNLAPAIALTDKLLAELEK